MKYLTLILLLGCSSENVGNINVTSTDSTSHDASFSIDFAATDETYNDVAVVEDTVDIFEDVSIVELLVVDASLDVSIASDSKIEADIQLEVSNKSTDTQQNDCYQAPGTCDDCRSCTDESGWTGVCIYAQNNSKCDDGNLTTVDKCNPQAPGADQITGCIHY